MFSNRIAADLRPNRLAQALAARLRDGLPVIDLTGSNPTHAGFEYPKDLLAPLAAERGLVYAPRPAGLIEARRAAAAEYGRRGIRVGPDSIVLTASTSESYSLLFKLLAAPGDEVIVPRPSYPMFELLAALDGLVAQPYDLEYHGTWSIDFASVERSIGPRTRAVLVVNPNNPTGSFISPGDLERLAGICDSSGIALIADEVFADYELEAGEAARAGCPLARRDVLVFSLGGASKAIGLPQIKLGWIAVSGPERTVSEALERLEFVYDTYLSVSTPVQLAAAELLERGTAVRSQIAARIATNYAGLKALAASAPSARVLRADGGWYAIVQVPTVRPEEELVLDLLTRDGVLTHPGYFFDFQRESYLVVSLLTPEARFATGIGRMLERAGQ